MLKDWVTMFGLLLMTAHGLTAQVRPKNQTPAKLRVPLQSGWKFREVGKDDWHGATVPGCVHTDLLNNKLIEDPFYRDNEQKLQWIGKTDWEYQTSFDVTPQLLDHRHLELVFEGLDTYANVFLNDTPLISTDNMFRTWRVDGKTALHAGPNTLRIRFRSPINEVLPIMAKLNYQLPSPNDQGEKTYPFTRKAAYHFGWDWGPRFVTSGIWKPLYLEAWDDARISDLNILQKEVNAISANLTAEVEIIADSEVDATVAVESVGGQPVTAQKKVRLSAGVNHVPLYLFVQHPSLWWPNGMGAQPLYNFRARLLINDRLSDQAEKRTGLRSLVLRRQPDKWGESFAFVINGVEVFAKGGNWIPADNFPTRVTKDKYRYLLQSVRDTNMNMLRVWGGGIYESDDFYSLCDEMGILIWQDFMFAGSMYPADKEFLDNVRAETADNVTRLRNHPSIVIWVGNNEIDSAWRNWGWKKDHPASLWEDYKKIFHGVIPEVCAALDPSRPYWPSSPYGGLKDDPDSAKSGDTHFWAVWHAAEPFSVYEKQLPRFMSEFGFQSFPQIETVEKYTLPQDRDIQSPVMMAHQRHPRGNQLIREYMLREYPQPKDFESFLYVSQVLQADGIKLGAEHFRRIRPINMGSLYWQIDDCWPVASWSSIDYYGRWKALQYYSRRFYSEVLVSPRVENGDINFYIVSDRMKPIEAQMDVSLLDFDGRVLSHTAKQVTIAPLQSSSYLNIAVSELLKEQDKTKVMVLCELSSNGTSLSTNEYFFEPYKNLSISPAHVSTNVVRTPRGFKISLMTDKFAKAVYLSAAKTDGFFSDNYIDLIPGKRVEIFFRPRAAVALNTFRNELNVRSMADAF